MSRIKYVAQATKLLEASLRIPHLSRDLKPLWDHEKRRLAAPLFLSWGEI
jgi:hypothetical protein